MKQKSLFVFLAFLTVVSSLQASIIKKPPTKAVESTFAELPCTESDKALIYELVSTIAENGKIQLLFKQNHLREIGAKINHVHPLKLLATIFSHPYLKPCMAIIWDDFFKRNGFSDGLNPALSREADKDRLNLFLDDFSKEVGISKQAIVPYFQSRDWDNLLLYLIRS